jgi:hypothetical protein
MDRAAGRGIADQWPELLISPHRRRGAGDDGPNFSSLPGRRSRSVVTSKRVGQGVSRPRRAALLGRSFIGAVGDGTVTVSPLDGGADAQLPAGAVVHITFHQPNLELAEALSTVAAEVRVIGEARTQRFLTVSLRDGYEAGRLL